MKVAIVCDWLTNVGGAEKVLLRVHKLYPEAPIYTSQYKPKGIDWFTDADVRTGWMQVFPAGLRRFLGPLRQIYFSHLKLSEYDLVISVTGAEAKAVKVPNGVHISYCHVPTQYYWQMYDEYVKEPGFGILNPLVRGAFKLFVRPLRRADYKAAQKVDYFVTISEYAKELIKKYYKREAEIIHPPVEINDFKINCGKSQIAKENKKGNCQGGDSAQVVEKSKESVRENIYITTSRQVTWKKIDLAVLAAKKLGRKLLVVGEGPEHKKLVEMANGSEVKFLPLMKKEKLAEELKKADGYLFPSMEPFGIAPVEALAAGCPVIAYGEGGARDYVIDGKNGILFKEQTTESLAEAILEFEKMKFAKEVVAKSAEKFSEERFDKELKEFVKKCEK